MRPTMRGGFTYAWYPDQRGVSCSIESNFRLEVLHEAMVLTFLQCTRFLFNECKNTFYPRETTRIGAPLLFPCDALIKRTLSKAWS